MRVTAMSERLRFRMLRRRMNFSREHRPGAGIIGSATVVHLNAEGGIASGPSLRGLHDAGGRRGDPDDTPS